MKQYTPSCSNPLTIHPSSLSTMNAGLNSIHYWSHSSQPTIDTDDCCMHSTTRTMSQSIIWKRQTVLVLLLWLISLVKTTNVTNSKTPTRTGCDAQAPKRILSRKTTLERLAQMVGHNQRLFTIRLCAVSSTDSNNDTTRLPKLSSHVHDTKLYCSLVNRCQWKNLHCILLPMDTWLYN
jgi:hypothetical protein